MLFADCWGLFCGVDVEPVCRRRSSVRQKTVCSVIVSDPAMVSRGSILQNVILHGPNSNTRIRLKDSFFLYLPCWAAESASFMLSGRISKYSYISELLPLFFHAWAINRNESHLFWKRFVKSQTCRAWLKFWNHDQHITESPSHRGDVFFAFVIWCNLLFGKTVRDFSNIQVWLCQLRGAWEGILRKKSFSNKQLIKRGSLSNLYIIFWQRYLFIIVYLQKESNQFTSISTSFQTFQPVGAQLSPCSAAR